MQEPKAITCPNCGKLISDYLEVCPQCGLVNPAQKKRVIQALSAKSFVKSLIWICGGFFALSYLLPLLLGQGLVTGRGMLPLLPAPHPLSLKLLGWADPVDVPRGAWWLLVTSVFLHGGGLHIVMNMLWLRDLGRLVEQTYNAHAMLFIFVFSGTLGQGLAIFLPLWYQGVAGNQFLWMTITSNPVVGASGGIFGLMGALILFGHRIGGHHGRMFANQFGRWALIMIVIGFLIPNVSNLGHIGGLIGGLLAGWVLPGPGKGRMLKTILGWGSLGVVAFSFLMVFTRLASLL